MRVGRHGGGFLGGLWSRARVGRGSAWVPRSPPAPSSTPLPGALLAGWVAASTALAGGSSGSRARDSLLSPILSPGAAGVPALSWTSRCFGVTEPAALFSCLPKKKKRERIAVIID